MLDAVEDVLVVVAVERRIAAQQDVQDDSARPDVALFVVVLKQDFRRYVVGRA